MYQGPPYRHSNVKQRPEIEWPDGKRLAVWIGLNVESHLIDKPSTSIHAGTAHLVPDPLNFGWRDYGPRVGVWRLMDMFDELKITPSILLNSDVCSLYPEIIEEGNARGWAWLGHGKNHSTQQAGMTEQVELAYLSEVIQVIFEGTGHRPRGWLGTSFTETFNTPRLLAGLGVTYLLDWCNDDQPYRLEVPNHRMISLPYSIEINDITSFVSRGLTPWEFRDLVKAQFDQLYKESAGRGLVMAMGLHPYLVGQPFRAGYFREALEHIRSHDDVWVTTADEIADWYLTHHDKNPT